MAAKFHERAFIAQVEAADAEELKRLLAEPNIEQERALRTHLVSPLTKLARNSRASAKRRSSRFYGKLSVS